MCAATRFAGASDLHVFPQQHFLLSISGLNARTKHQNCHRDGIILSSLSENIFLKAYGGVLLLLVSTKGKGEMGANPCSYQMAIA